MTALEAMKERLKRATPGPWTVDEAGDELEIGPTDTFVCRVDKYENYESNAEFIAHSREDMERLIAAVEVQTNALRLSQKMMNNLMAKGNINWGNTFGIDFGLMNEALLAQDKALAEADAILEGK